MNPELFSSIICAALVAWGAYAALRATWSRTRSGLLGGVISAVFFALIVRLIGPFGGWADWFVWVWIGAMCVFVVAAYRAVLVWPDLPWHAEETKTRRSEATGLGISAVLALLVAGALVLPGLFI